MKKSTRTQFARETVAICETGTYQVDCHQSINLTSAIAAARNGTKLHSPDDLFTCPNESGKDMDCAIEVTSESTMEALHRLSAAPTLHLACLNFASAKNPGGGFLNGAQAQEETLARSSALYPCLLSQPSFYERNRTHKSLLYLDLAIFSPRVPFFRNDDGALLQKPYEASVITAPAPNAGAIAINEPGNLPRIEATLKRRAELVLAIAVHHAVTHLVLGAWGCGVFRNDPSMVARTFAQLLTKSGSYSSHFAHVVFAIHDRSPSKSVFNAFSETFSER